MLASRALPPGTQLQDIPKMLAKYRLGGANLVAQRFLEMMVEEDLKAARPVHNEIQGFESAGNVAGEDGGNSGNGGLDSHNADSNARGSNAEVIITATGTAYDPQTLDVIARMNIPDELKNELRRHYLRTGALPGLGLNVQRNPADASLGQDDVSSSSSSSFSSSAAH